jgi:hypothetical protein
MNIEEVQYVFKNKDLLISQKQNVIKRGDVVIGSILKNEHISKEDEANKAEGDTVELENAEIINVKAVINTTNVIDSHMDCHIPGLWKKTLSETKLLYLLQEHDMKFDKIISDSVNDELKAYTQKIAWNKLGQTFEGNTEALIFEGKVKKDVNEFMFNLYKNGRVLNHSVGMRYVKIYLCINSTEAYYASEKDNWDKYYPEVANKEIADERGYFWAVTEAKVIEGSAVVKGSNEFTPTLEIEAEKQEPEESTQETEIKEEPIIEITQIRKRGLLI